MRQTYHQPLNKLNHRKNTGTGYNLSVFRKIKNLFSEIQGDFVSCRNRARFLLQSSPVDKRILAIGLVVVFIFALSINPNPNDILFYFLKVVFVSVISFIIFTLSDTFWFLIKKNWMYKVHIKKRSTINYYLKRINILKIEDSEKENPEGAIYVISYNNFAGFKYHAWRNGIEASILLIILLYFFPTFFVFNLLLFCMLFFYVMIFDNQSSSQVFEDIKNLVFCVRKIYKDNPENCRKFIFENKMESVRELGAIYRTVRNSVEK